MKKLIAFLIFLLAAMLGATAQEVLGQQIPLPLADEYKNTEFLPVAPSYSDILMMKALSSSELLAMPKTPLTPIPFATEPPLAYKYDASHSGGDVDKDFKRLEVYCRWNIPQLHRTDGCAVGKWQHAI